MPLLNSIFSILSLLITLYTIVIMVRILLTWVQGPYPQGEFMRIVCAIVDPYLNLFRRLRFLRIGMIDFSPIVGIGVLYLIQSLLRSGASSLTPLGFLLSVLGWAFGIVDSIIGFFALILIIRCVLTFVKESGNNPFINGIDALLTPIVSRILGLFVRKPVRYRYALLICAGMFFLIGFLWRSAGSMLLGSLSTLLPL